MLAIFESWTLGSLFNVLLIGYVFAVLFISSLAFLVKWVELAHQKEELQLQIENMIRKDRYYENLQLTIEQFQFFRHDFSKHMNLLDILLDSGEYQKASSYLKELNSSYHRELKITHYTKDVILNHILSNKKMAAEERDIEVRISAAITGIPKLTSQELCCVFDNLFDNAIHANMKIEAKSERFIDLFLLDNNDCISIVMKNRCIGSLKFLEPEENKKEKLNEAHGYGLRILERIITKAHGNISKSLDLNEHIFTVELNIPRQSNAQAGR